MLGCAAGGGYDKSFTDQPGCAMIKTLSQEDNFLDLPEELSGFQKSQVVILPIPFEESTTFVQGTKDGPQAIITASRHLEDYDDELNAEPCRVGIATAEPLDLNGLHGRDALDRIEEVAADIMQTGKFVVGLGGEHTITVPLVRAAYQTFHDLTVLHLDAHSDLRDEYEGSKFNHACVMARVNEICDFVSIGLRSGLQDEGKDLRPGARLFYAYDMVRDSSWQDRVLDHLSDNVYLTVDLDYFDPAVMPAVGTPEPGGFHWYDTLEFLRKLMREKNVVACDVVELSPVQGLVHPNMFAAKLVYKLIGYRFFGRLRKYG